ncbi:hypothetical protein B7494_g5939 [Chlorociboria aeruginascens]|nr:hypothetical protein B7494_g5939 [Chlorociboria aeruginascens]
MAPTHLESSPAGSTKSTSQPQSRKASSSSSYSQMPAHPYSGIRKPQTKTRDALLEQKLQCLKCHFETYTGDVDKAGFRQSIEVLRSRSVRVMEEKVRPSMEELGMSMQGIVVSGVDGDGDNEGGLGMDGVTGALVVWRGEEAEVEEEKGTHEMGGLVGDMRGLLMVEAGKGKGKEEE